MLKIILTILVLGGVLWCYLILKPWVEEQTNTKENLFPSSEMEAPPDWFGPFLPPGWIGSDLASCLNIQRYVINHSTISVLPNGDNMVFYIPSNDGSLGVIVYNLKVGQTYQLSGYVGHVANTGGYGYVSTTDLPSALRVKLDTLVLIPTMGPLKDEFIPFGPLVVTATATSHKFEFSQAMPVDKEKLYDTSWSPPFILLCGLSLNRTGKINWVACITSLLSQSLTAMPNKDTQPNTTKIPSS